MAGRRRPEWHLTVRHGSRVDRHGFDLLEDAVAEMKRRAEQVAEEGSLPSVKAFRDYEPGMRIHARLEISGRGLLKSPTAGVDLMGDGRLVAYRGGVRRKELDLEDGESPYTAVRRALQT